MAKETIQLQQRFPVMEAFYTLQGEGFYAGQAAYFIRLGGCDVGCVWCDVKESWDAGKHPVKSVDEIVAMVRNETRTAPGSRLPIVVVTGGEPLMHDLSALTHSLHQFGYQVNIETSGSSPLSGEIDWICLSPKKFKAPLPELLPFANELKVVVFNKSDFAWAERHAVMVSPDCRCYLQPEWDRRATMTPLIVSYIKENPRWQLSLQTHKYIGVP